MRHRTRILLVFCLAAAIGETFAARCEREPEGRTSDRTRPGGRFSIVISGNPKEYTPNTGYTITIQGFRTQGNPPKFTGFMLVVEPANSNGEVDWLNLSRRNPGRFTLFADTLTKFSEKCRDAVVQTSSIPKADIQVVWNAPPTGNGCVVIRATVVEHRDVWYMDDDDLSKVLCEKMEDNLDSQSPPLDHCCACDEAKYEVTFEGLWSRHTHPKDFPSNGWSTKFSDVIGATHTRGYKFWDYGEIASQGLQQVAEKGSTRLLESELKEQSTQIRTIIKARGISYPNVTGKTFAVFRVDKEHHLMSLVSMIEPSPDWIVGVSALELCLPNCSWVEHKTMNLFPFDVGTDSGVTYMSPDAVQEPRDIIRRLTTSYPNDPGSPFFNEPEIKPFARLYLSRQRLYEKNCNNTKEPPVTSEDYNEEFTTSSHEETQTIEILSQIKEQEQKPEEHCKVTKWSNWSACSVTCGSGYIERRRSYKEESSYRNENCTKRLSKKKSCHLPMCDNCKMGPWSNWSPCTVTCGTGVKQRTRNYKKRQTEFQPGCERLETQECINPPCTY